MFQPTQRPINECEDCGYTWHPRGKNVSLHCPNCRSTDISYYTYKQTISWNNKFLASILGLFLLAMIVPNHNKFFQTVFAGLFVSSSIGFVYTYFSGD